MTEHPDESLLLRHFDGTATDADERLVAAHVASCADCRAELDRLGALESFVARNLPEDTMTAAAMFATAERVLVGAARRRRRRRTLVAFALAAAAACLGMLAWFASGDDRARVRLVRHRPDELLRSDAPARFHLELTASAPVFVTAFVRLPGGDVDELLPGATPAEPVRGAVRLPANPLLDWEYPASRAPREVLVILSPRAPSDAERHALRSAWRDIAAGSLPPQAVALGDAELLAMPPAQTGPK